MKPIRAAALKLRLAGKSYNEISNELGIPKATLSDWFSGLVLSSSAQQRLSARVRRGTLNGLVKRNRLQTHHARERARRGQEEGIGRISRLSQEDLMLAGAILYWAEGYKRLRIKQGKELTQHVISFVNADADMIRLFIKFLKEVMNISESRILLSMRLYPHINEGAALRYWEEATSLPKACFRRTTYLVSTASKGKRPFNRLPFGTLQVTVNSTKDFHILMGMLQGVKNGF